MLPLHHGTESSEPKNWLQSFNDSEAGVLSAGILHSVGALLFAGGIALYLYVAHSMRRAGRHGGPTHAGLLNYAHWFTIAGIATNGVGGLMRLYETDHPGIDRLGDSTWVQVLFAKHLFLVVGVGLALYLAWRTWRIERSASDGPGLQREGSRMAFFAAASLATILLAAVLGAMATNVDLAADLGDAVAPPPGMDEHPVAPGVLNEFETSGVTTGTPVQPQATNHRFTVPAGADRLELVLRWRTENAILEVALFDPANQRVRGEATATATTATLTLEGALATGSWRAEVTGRQAINEAYTLRVAVLHAQGLGNIVEKTVTVAPGAFYEINLLMQQGRQLSYRWSVVDSSANLYFDIHLHPNAATVTYPVRGEWNRLEGNYTHDGSTQGPSLLWDNNGTQSVRVAFRITGGFSVHSQVPANAAPAAFDEVKSAAALARRD